MTETTGRAETGEVGGEPIERPATWENVLVGRAKEGLGRVLRDKELAEEGEEQAEVAHEVHEEYRES